MSKTTYFPSKEVCECMAHDGPKFTQQWLNALGAEYAARATELGRKGDWALWKECGRRFAACASNGQPMWGRMGEV